jgi:hypothetical protein
MQDGLLARAALVAAESRRQRPDKSVRPSRHECLRHERWAIVVHSSARGETE